MVKKIVLLLFCAACCSCDAGKYFFNQRIGQGREQTPPAEQVVPTPQENEQPAAGRWKPALSPDSAQVVKTETVVNAPAEVPVNKRQYVTAPKVPAAGQEKTPFVQPVKIVNGAGPHRPVVAASAGISGFGIFMLVLAGIAVLTFLISLLLGFSVGQAALYGLIALVIVIVILVWLLLLAASSDNWGSNDDKDDAPPEDD